MNIYKVNIDLSSLGEVFYIKEFKDIKSNLQVKHI